MNLHDKIMNIRVDEDRCDNAVKVNLDMISPCEEENSLKLSRKGALRLAYKMGHRDARHAAAELAIHEEKDEL